VSKAGLKNQSATDRGTGLGKAPVIPRGIRELIPCLVCALIVGLFVWGTDPNIPIEATGPDIEGAYYNLLVQGFSQGHLYVNRDAPAALARLANPYDPTANAPYIAAVNDLSYYKGKLYMYFGVTPALVLFWPYHFLADTYLSEGSAVAILFAVGFAVTLGLARAICRRYFPETNIWILTICVLILGLAMGLTLSGSIYEIAIACGFLFAIMAITAVWHAMHASARQQLFWLLFASFAYGLAIGSRPSLLFGAIFLLMPVIQTWRAGVGPGNRWRTILSLASATGPIMLIGLGLMLYFITTCASGTRWNLAGVIN
jgi:hypothetical protein